MKECVMAPKKGRNLSDDKRFGQVVDQLASGYKTIGQMVYAVLHEAITNGAFAPGEWLRQESLAEAIGVSRIPVRTALLQLESEGLVTFHPHRGARVRTLSPAQIDEIYGLRVLLEAHALRLSMARMTADRLAHMQGLAEKLDAEPEGVGFLDTRVRFYREVYDASNNPLLVEMIEELRGHVGRFLLGFRFDGQGHAHRKHASLVEHVRSGDLIAAENWLRSHLEEVRAGILELATTGGDDDVAAADADEPGDGVDDQAVAAKLARAKKAVSARNGGSAVATGN
jgi:DNA-binding GntR family transcriptional regulator